MAIPQNDNYKSSYPQIFLDTRMVDAGIEVFRFYYDRMIKSERGTILGENTKYLHDMRVATRRMRVAIDIFGEYFERINFKRFNDSFKRTGKTLGRVRDLDVLLELLDHYREIKPRGQMNGIEPVIVALELMRKKERVKMLEYLSGEKYKKSKDAFESYLISTENGQSPNLSDVKVRFVYTQLVNKQMKAFRILDKIEKKPTVDKLHRARIAFKNLRYTVEYFYIPIDEKAQLLIRYLKEIQDHLGRINDINMLLNVVERLTFEETYNPTTQQKKSNQYFLDCLQEELHQLIGAIPIIWNKYDKNTFGDCFMEPLELS
jgi:CHAD domain-containing protein